ncbi:AAA family ATPase [Ensifer aridi]|uniref:AAA family ATPase n=1 Tax=Ensifer aridi TaxID=1708715 RepID=UPI001AEC7374|nr:AAA family ATPase [Ensifer aridi]
MTLKKFRRFHDLTVRDIPPEAKLVVLAGPNGSGKSSLFDALLLRYRMDAGYGWSNDLRYFLRDPGPSNDVGQGIVIQYHDRSLLERGSVYVRTAHRSEPDFVTSGLSRQGEILEQLSLNRLIETDATVAKNYQRLASQALEDVFVTEADTTTMGDFRDKVIGECRGPLKRLFPDLTFAGVGNPLNEGTFQFHKGTSKNFPYKNLSGGEKAAFDLILDVVVKRRSYSDAVYCIDEPEIHMNTRIQGALLAELVDLVPDQSQLWIASHSIGMMRKARELYEAKPGLVVFLDFGDRDFDQATTIVPSKPTRAFWKNVMHVALDDLASLVAPGHVVICEGNPAGPVPGKNAEHDAQIYNAIFAEENPDVTFISAGNSKEVEGDFLGLAASLPKVASGMKVTKLIDRDDHAPDDVVEYNKAGISVLSRRHLEAYLYDDEVLTALCNSVGKSADASELIARKDAAIESSINRGNAADDIKKVAGNVYVEAKKLLGLTQVGNDPQKFARNTLAPLLQPGMVAYDTLKKDIFG